VNLDCFISVSLKVTDSIHWRKFRGSGQGGHLTDGKFAAETKGRADQDRVDGWSITYQKQKEEWAVWSGAEGDRIFYERAILTCDGAAAYFRLEYDKEKARVFDPPVFRLVGSLRSETCRR